MIVVRAPDGRVEEINPFGERVTGYERGELRGADWFAVVPPPARRDDERAEFAALVAAADAHACRVAPLVTRAGRELAIEWSHEVVRDGAGHVSSVVSVGRDVTERERVAAHQRRVQAMIGVASWARDLVSGVPWWSPEMYALLGIAPHDAPPSFEGFLSAVHADDRGEVRAAFARARADGRAYEIEHRLRGPGGEYRYVRDQIGFELDADGTAVRAFGTLLDVTSRVQHELRLRNILDAMFAFVVVVDLDGRIIEVNQPVLDVLGRGRADIIGAAFVESAWGPEAEDARAALRGVLARAATGEVVREEIRVTARPGVIAVFDTVFGPLRDASGAVVSVVGSGVDVTARATAEAAAKRSGDLLQAVVRAAPVALFALDPQGRYTVSEGSVLAKVGVRPGEMVGESMLERFADTPGIRATFARAMSGEQFTNHAQVGPVALDVFYAPSRDPSGAVDGVVGVAVDVTEQRRAEAALRDREARLAAVFHHASDSMTLLAVEADGTLRVVAGNRAMLTRLQELGPIDESRVLGLTMTQLTLDVYRRPPEALAQYLAAMAQVVATRQPMTFEHVLALPTRTMVAEVSLAPVLDAAGATAYVLWSSRDVTARRQADAQMRTSLAEKETLLREIHHRVKNNLQVIASLLHFHAKRLHAPADVAAIGELRQRIIAMTLVHERLYKAPDVARIAFGEYARALVAELQRSVGRRSGVTLTVVAEDLLLPIELALPSGMILCELVTNVLKYAFPPGRTGTATVHAREEGGQVVLRVDDDGVGFPPDFDPAHGSSFGWELVRTLAVQLGATVDATSHAGAHVRVAFAARPPRPEGR